MRRFFTEPDNIDLDNGTLTIIDDAAHISKVLRMECGDKIIVFDGTGYEYEAMLIKIEKEKSIANILGRSLSELEPEIKVTLFQGIPKSDKLEIIVQKAVELGVHDIVPVKTSRSVAKIADDKKGRQKSCLLLKQDLNKIMRRIIPVEAKELTKLAVKALEDKKGEDIRVIDIHGVSVLADYFVIADGSNASQVKAMADNVEEELGKAGHECRQIEGYQTAGWILMDYGDLIVHIFSRDDRLFYDLERIWRDGKVVENVEEL